LNDAVEVIGDESSRAVYDRVVDGVPSPSDSLSFVTAPGKLGGGFSSLVPIGVTFVVLWFITARHRAALEEQPQSVDGDNSEVIKPSSDKDMTDSACLLRHRPCQL